MTRGKKPKQGSKHTSFSNMSQLVRGHGRGYDRRVGRSADWLAVKIQQIFKHRKRPAWCTKFPRTWGWCPSLKEIRKMIQQSTLSATYHTDYLFYMILYRVLDKAEEMHRRGDRAVFRKIRSIASLTINGEEVAFNKPTTQGNAST